VPGGLLALFLPVKKDGRLLKMEPVAVESLSAMLAPKRRRETSTERSGAAGCTSATCE
jgi:hypothetical protein